MRGKKIASPKELGGKPSRTPIHANEIIPQSFEFWQGVKNGVRVGAILAAVLAVGFGRNSTAIIVTGMAIFILSLSYLKEVRA